MDRITSSPRFKQLRHWWARKKHALHKCKEDLSDRTRWSLQFTWRRIAVFVLDFAWMVILWGVILTKVWSDGLFTYIGFFTNWSWIYQAVYYLVYLFSFIEDPHIRGLEYWMLYAFWWNMFAQTIIILVLVFAIFQDNAYILIGETKTGGGTHSDGTVINYNFLVHYCPPIVALINMWIVWPDIADVLTYTFGFIEYDGAAPEKCDTTRFAYVVRMRTAWLYIWTSTLLAIVPLLVFYNAFDVREVYHLEDFPTWAGIIITILLAFATVMLPMQYIFRSTIPSRVVPHYQRKARDFNEHAVATYRLAQMPIPSE